MLNFMYRGFYNLDAQDMQPRDASFDVRRENVERELRELRDESALHQGWLSKTDQRRLDSLERELNGLESVSPNTILTLDDHIRVNRIAEYYDVPLLLDQSRQNIRDFLTRDWSPDKFKAICETVLKESATGDVLLARMLGQLVAEHSH